MCCCRAALSLSILLGLGVAGHSAAQEVPDAPPDLDRYVEQVMQAFEVPGIALTIVKDGEVVIAKGYGVRKIDEDAPVNAHTRFGIASNTKAFTATALALLVEEGKLEWDAPVIEYLPWFQMWDPWVTREITVRDLLVHRSGLGLGQGDLLGWPPSTRTREEIVRRIRYLKPATSFRSAYAYDNVLYHVAALVIEEVSGQTWEEFVASRIIAKLGMNETRVSRASTREPGNVATPHARVDGVVRPVQPFDATNTNASGGINSTAADMAKWLIVQLDSGRVADGSPLFTPRTTRELWSPVTTMPIGRPPAELEPLATDYRGYALAFVVQEYRGRKMVTHTGSLPGYVSRVAMIPELELGVAVLTNQEAGAAFEAITYRILDHYLDADETDWLAAYIAVEARRDSASAGAEVGEVGAEGTAAPPSLQVEGYAGTYTDAWYGDVTITMEEGGLAIRFSKTPSLVGDLEHFNHNTFIARWRDRELRADAYVTFVLDPSGDVDEVKMQAVSPLTDFSYDFHDLLLKPATGLGGTAY
ncbi:MAG: serine hydrolase [Gemmatimonadota bacterium]|nr:MAG: serine hydrolase [Gemmatimonadota bacterium]